MVALQQSSEFDGEHLPFLQQSAAFLIELSTSEAVERPNEQKDCREGDGDVHATAHLFHNTRFEDCTGEQLPGT